MYVFCVVTRYTRSLVFVWLLKITSTKAKFYLIFQWCSYPLWYFCKLFLLQPVACVCHCVKENALSMILEIHAIQKS